jgi:AcrR family transcriptional regulator
MQRPKQRPRTPAPASPLLPRRQPLQARARLRVNRILDASVELLAEQGAEALSTGTIARRAGVPIGSVYQYFPSKDAILAALADRKFRDVDSAFVRAVGRDLETMPWRRAVERAADLSVAAFRGDPAYVAVWRAMRSSPAFRSAAAAGDERFARGLAALPLIAALPAARALTAMRSGIRLANTFMDWVLEQDDPREAAAIVRELKRALIAYLAEDLDAATRATAPRARTVARKRKR